MKKPRKRPTRPVWETLEERRLLSSGPPTGRWIGQDLHDLVGRSSVPGPSGVQDIRIAIENLPTGRTVSFADVQGHGGGQWLFNGRYGPWAAAFVQEPGSTSADVFIEPYQYESGRRFSIQLRYDDGSSTTVYFTGGEADPNLRMPSASARATWTGQDGSDRVGLGPSVGPDGRLDAVLALSNLSSQFGIERVVVTGPGGVAWQYGTNPQANHNAELVRQPGDPTRATLFLQPDRDLAGVPLMVRINYENGTSDETAVLAGTTDPSLVVPSPPPLPVRSDAITVDWLGQSNIAQGPSGHVGLRISGLPVDRVVVGATLSNDVRGQTWVYRPEANSSYYAEPNALALSFRRTTDPAVADVSFPPVRDENGSLLTLRLLYDDGTTSITRFSGRSTDVTLRAPRPAPTEILARPGDDLNALANQYGTVKLAPGDYRLNQPLILSKPVQIIGQPGATLIFDQPSNTLPWTAAIKIHQGNTTLQGFAVRFAGPVRWNWTVPYDPAVIGTTDPLDGIAGGLKVGLSFIQLDIEAPPVLAGAGLQESPKLFRLVTAENGTILGNRLRGGTTQFQGGPWVIAENTYLGTTPGTRAFDVFAGQWTRDVSIRDNIARPEPGSGKTYRFVVLTGSGDNVSITGNTVEDIGPRDNDVIAHPNAPETILTEAYRIRFEGRPLAVSPDGRVVQIQAPQGDPIRAGDVLAILSGPNGGQWRRVAQVVNPTTILLEAPLPTDVPLPAISISTGFVDLSIRGNVVDVRGSSEAAPLVLVGAQFGTEVSGNRFRGGLGSRIVAKASEQPVHWGWSFTPVLDASITSNTFEDALKPLSVGVDRNGPVKTSKDRVYFEGDLTGNIVAWSPSFLSSHSLDGVSPIAFRVGHVRALDPVETLVHASGNGLKLPPGLSPGPGLDVHVATLNGEAIVDATLPLPLIDAPAPPRLHLFRDTGASDTDGITSDPRFVLEGPPNLTYEYRLDGSSTFNRLSSGGLGQPISPGSLADGAVTIWARTLDEYDRPSESVPFRFILDTTPPNAPSPTLDPTSDSGRSTSDRITRVRRPLLQAPIQPDEFVTLLVNGTIGGSRTGPGQIQVASPLPDGPNVFSLRVQDRAGNTSTSSDLLVQIDTVAPAAMPPSLTPSSDTGFSSTDRVTSDQRPVFHALAQPEDTVALLVDGQERARRAGGGTIAPTTLLADGVRLISLRLEDRAGNVSISTAIPVTIDTVPPVASPPKLLASSDTGISSTDRITRDRLPVFRVDAAPQETVILLVNGIEVSRGTGPETIAVPSALSDGEWSVSVRLQDAAGNSSTSPALSVTLDTRGTGPVSGLRDAGQGLIQFDPHPEAASYEYRLGNGPFVSIGTQTSLRIPGLAWGANTVVVRTVDVAGNAGAETPVVVNLPRPRGVWMGQTSRADLAGPWSNRVGPDGFADVRIQLFDLPVDREIAFLDIQGKGGGRWQFGNPRNEHWRIALARTPGASTADAYFQPGRSDPPREYQVLVRFTDGSSAEFYIRGGFVFRSLRGIQASGGLGGPLPASSTLKNNAPWARRWAALLAARAARTAGPVALKTIPGQTGGKPV